MNVSQNTQNPDEIMKALEKFGFKFFGHNESGVILVTAPNGQIVDVNVAYKFLQIQLQNAQTGGTTGIESSPQLPANIELSPTKEPSLEEFEKNLEKPDSKKENIDQQESNPVPTRTQTAPKMSLPSTNSTYFSDGYSKFNSIDLDLTKPENILTLENFINNNAKKENSDPLKWLTYMFQKTLQELKEEQENK